MSPGAQITVSSFAADERFGPWFEHDEAEHALATYNPSDPVWYEADESQIRQIVWNLATNGLRAMADGDTVYGTDRNLYIAIGDGGYRDNSGATSIADAWSVIEPTMFRAMRGTGAPARVRLTTVPSGRSSWDRSSRVSTDSTSSRECW